MISTATAWLFVSLYQTTFAYALVSPLPRTGRPRSTNVVSRSRTSVGPLGALTTSQEEHAREVFSIMDKDRSETIDSSELASMLSMLDIDATEDDAHALFKYLDSEGDGEIGFEDDFLPWYAETAGMAMEVASSFQSLLVGRRTVEKFDQTLVSDDVLRRAVQCAIAAPNRSLSEPWRFIKIGPVTVEKFAQLKSGMESDAPSNSDCTTAKSVDWTTIPGWCVVTSKLTDNDPSVEQEDFKATCCAVQNFMLSMWSEGIGTKWTSGPVQRTQEFADLCGVDTAKEKVAGCIWYGFASGGLVSADPKRRKQDVDDVLSSVA